MALSYSTLYWVTGSLLLTAAMFTGATRLLVKEFDEDKFWHYVDKYKVICGSFFILSPLLHSHGIVTVCHSYIHVLHLFFIV